MWTKLIRANKNVNYKVELRSYLVTNNNNSNNNIVHISFCIQFMSISE